MKQSILVLDPIPFRGGSKVATENILQLVDRRKSKITVLTHDENSWRMEGIRCEPLWEPKWLMTSMQGLPYFLRHFILLLNVIRSFIKHGRAQLLVGASGPGVDLALYFAKALFKGKIIQLIHGPVAVSRTIGRCLLFADRIFCLESARTSVESAVAVVGGSLEGRVDKCSTFVNGLPDDAWPTPSGTQEVAVLWAASLLKWKGMETLMTALEQFEARNRPQTHICYIRPKEASLPVSQAPISMDKVVWHESPDELDRIRSGCSVFVSTSYQEPFGLSILEALAAGLCVLIPEDGAYWDRMLTDGVNCVKYEPANPQSLARKLRLLKVAPQLLGKIGREGQKVAEKYRASSCYRNIIGYIESTENAVSSMPGGWVGNRLQLSNKEGGHG